MTRKRAILTLAALIGFATTLAIEGCAHPRPVLDPTPRLTAPLAVTKSENAAVHSEHAAAATQSAAAHSDLKTAAGLTTTQPAAHAAVVSADQHVHAIDQHLTLAESHAVNVDKATAVVQTEAVAVGKESVAAQTDRNDAIAKYNALYNSWHEKIYRGILWVLGAYLALWVLTGVLEIPALDSPVIAFALKALKFCLTFGGSLFSHATNSAHAAVNDWYNKPGNATVPLPPAPAAPKAATV